MSSKTTQRMSVQEKNKVIIEEAINTVMPNIVDMISNNKYEVSIEKLPDGSIRFIKDSQTYNCEEELLSHLKLFVNMFIITKDAQGKVPKAGVTSQPSQG